MENNIEVINKIDDLKEMVEKSCFMLTEFFEEYTSRDMTPTPQKAQAYMNSHKTSTDEERYSAKWFLEYDRINKLIRIAYDYNIQSIELMDQISESIKSNRVNEA